MHAVAIGLVPIFSQSFVGGQKRFEFFLGHGGIPLSGIAQAHLFARLFEDVAGLWLVLKPADAFASNDLVWPMLGNEAVEVNQVERLAAIVNKGADAIFLHLPAVVMVMVLVFVMMVFVLIVVVFMVIFVLMFVMMMMFFLFLLVVMMVLNGVNPCGRCSHFVEIEAVGVYEQV